MRVWDSQRGPVDLDSLRIRSIARRSPDGALVTLLDGGELALSGTADVGDGHRGIYVDDRRYGRVLIPWDSFERVDFTPGGSGPAYGDFPAGTPLTGAVAEEFNVDTITVAAPPDADGDRGPDRVDSPATY